MFVGSITVIVWSNLEGGLFDLYELVPGFVVASFSIIFLNRLAPQVNKLTLKEFDDITREIDAT